MQRSINLSRSPLSKLLALRAKARAIRPEAQPGKAKSVSAGPPLPMAEQLSRSREARFISWL